MTPNKQITTFGEVWKSPEGDFHREDGPAIEYFNGDTEWWFNGYRHREDGPAIDRVFNNRKEYWLSGKRHREDGPAIIASEYVEYWINGKRHRIDGPAVVGKTYDSWWINGYPVHNEIIEWSKKFNIDLNNLTDEDKQMIFMYWVDYGK